MYPNSKVKTAGIRIRIEPELRDAFAKECRRNEVNAASVLRDFMKQYIDEGEASRQGKLFPQETKLNANSIKTYKQ